jgi:tRNA threonylcarbamoyladenosine biosynthesis protein TsaE
MVEIFKEKFICHTAEELITCGECFGKMLIDGDVVALFGDLGAGKTTFTQGIARALAVDEPVTSPTFNIVSLYKGKINFVHIDAYRLDVKENLNVLEYVCRPFVIVIEWPQNLPEMKDEITKNVQISMDNDGSRKVEIM